MRQVFIVLGALAGIALFVLFGAFAWGRLRPPTPAQAEALRLLQPATMPPGRNAWPLLWLIDYDVPADRIDAAYAQERAHMQDWASHMPANPSMTAMIYRPLAATQYSKRPAISNAEYRRLCAIGEHDCLAKVRAEGQPLRDLLARQSGRLAQVEAVNTADELWDDQPRSVYAFALSPGFQNTEDLLLTATVADFVDGRQAQALVAVCHQAAGLRRLHAHTNTVLGAMLTAVWMEADERALAGMLGELPKDQVIPDECMRAFALPTQGDVSLCMPMQQEFADFVAIMHEGNSGRQNVFERLQTAVMFDNRDFRLQAPTYAWACQPSLQSDALADRPLPMASLLTVRNDFFDTLSNAGGFVLARIAAPAFTQYAARNQDYAASLRLMAWLLRTRATATTAAAWQLQLTKALPTLRGKGRRNISVDPDGRFLRMRYYATYPDHVELALSLMK
ncbi:hypothetical protein IHE49_14745 [Rhodanobacter sp. 7MK24]|uniref:hypothetical protein n=1 Tax=Rhodanobacter sp. 7MK24 TaxID=2775922 RepID=UPI00178690A7|nr:hypothetical protein [Rhodanobacter sp. 7MK24]MBD8881742.1 hypothetical protein [Rhodanobacter sp. 7MK24]